MNHYEVLGVDRDASLDVIKRRYQHLVLQHHPDKQDKGGQGATTTDKFIAITEAWNCLKDELKRRQYDSKLAQEHESESENFYAEYTESELAGLDWRVQCRCGAEFAINQNGSGSVVYECDDCSLSVLVTYGK